MDNVSRRRFFQDITNQKRQTPGKRPCRSVIQEKVDFFESFGDVTTPTLKKPRKDCPAPVSVDMNLDQEGSTHSQENEAPITELESAAECLLPAPCHYSTFRTAQWAENESCIVETIQEARKISYETCESHPVGPATLPTRNQGSINTSYKSYLEVPHLMAPVTMSQESTLGWLPILLILAVTMTSLIVWAAFSYVQVPLVRFCDTEALYAMDWDLDCDGCPKQGYCAYGNLQACEPPAVQHSSFCAAQTQSVHVTAGIIRLMHAALRSEHCGAFRVRGLTVGQLKDAIRPRFANLSPPEFEQVWSDSLARLQPHPGLYGLKQATVAGEPGFEWFGSSWGERALCLCQRSWPRIVFTALALAVVPLALLPHTTVADGLAR